MARNAPLIIALSAALATLPGTASMQSAVAAASSTDTGFTGVPGPRRAHRAGPMLTVFLHAAHQLNLSADQKQGIRGLLDRARAQRRAQGPFPDWAALADPGDPGHAAAVQAAQARLSARIEADSELEGRIYDLLTPQQKAQLPQVLASMRARWQQRRAAWDARQADPGASGGSGTPDAPVSPVAPSQP